VVVVVGVSITGPDMEEAAGEAEDAAVVEVAGSVFD